MNPEEGDFFCLPLLLTVATIIFSFIILRKLFYKNSPIQAIPAQNASLNTPSAADSAGGEYEVFLSFRGEDTRTGFTDFLYTYLVGAGIRTFRTFRDDNELRIGEKIGPDLLKAINESKISIPIFSKNYAGSKWCLLELAQMAECHKTEGKMIFPIFYDIQPSDVRNQNGNYEKAFRQHEKKFGKKTVQGWKDAMTKVGKLKGLELKKATNGHEGELVKMVVEEVMLVLKKNYTHVPDILVGMDRHVKEMERLLDVNYNGVRVVGIHGMGGIGKTTISKVVYNQLCDRFDCCCFLDDVRERSQHHNGVVVLQHELVSKITKQKFTGISNPGEGIDKIKDVVGKKKVLIVLDDIDGISQFNKLVGKCDWFCDGSRIVITTRNKEVLDTVEVTCRREGSSDVYKSYEPQLMNDDQSLILFSNYAFKQKSPPQEYNILSKDVVYTASGLPLVLVTIGSFLFGKEEQSLWEEILRKLQRIPHKDVLEKLRISFEALEYEQQQIFLDIACLFTGEDKSNPIYMWDACGYYPRSGVNTLVLRSLVRVDDDNKLRMHDQLRDLGRQIVREENLKEVGERSRVWDPEEALDVLKGGSGAEKVEALNLNLKKVRKDEYEKLVQLRYNYIRSEFVETSGEQEKQYIRRFGEEDFSHLPSLRFLRLGYVSLYGDFRFLFSNLRWLDWRCCQKIVPIYFNPKNLVILDLSNSAITDEWERWTSFKVAKKLKVLNISGCKSLRRAPDFFTTLEILNLSRTRLEQINSWLSKLTTLRVLDLSYCRIEVLDCSTLTNLQMLNLRSTRLEKINSWLRKLKALRALDLSYCYCIKKIDCSTLTDLVNLNLHRCKSLSKVSGVEKSTSLTNLNTSFCECLTTLGNLSNLKKLKVLDINNCTKLTEIQGLEELESLERLSMMSCKGVARLPVFSKLKKLKQMLLSNCEKLVTIGGLGGLASMEHLDLRNCKSIIRLPVVSNSKMLKKLILYDCRKLSVIEGLGGSESLEVLDMYGCTSILRLPDLSNAKMLKTLILRYCKYLPDDVGDLGGLESLEHLDLMHCESMVRLPKLPNPRKLKRLYVSNCKKLNEIESFSDLVSVEILSLSYCDSLEKNLDLSNLKNLKFLRLDGLNHWTEFRGLEEVKSLQKLSIGWCSLLAKLPDFSSFVRMEEICVAGCVNLAPIQGREELEKRGCKIRESRRSGPGTEDIQEA